MEKDLPSNVKTYLAEIVKSLILCLKDELVGVYLFGSAACDAYEPGLSDLDVQAVVKNSLSIDDKQAIVSRVNQNALPCPATKLEFVVYAQEAIRPATRHPRFEINLNTGPHQTDHVGLDPSKEASHWFLLDIAMGRELGHCLYGLGVSEAFDVVPRCWVLEAIADSLEWHRCHASGSANNVLNACRGWRYVVDGKFGSKLDSAAWAVQQMSCSKIVEHAVAARKTKGELPADQVMELYEIVRGLDRISSDAEHRCDRTVSAALV